MTHAPDSQGNDWRVVAEHDVHTGFRRVRSRTLGGPGDTRAEFEVKVESDGAAVVPVTTEGRIVMARQFRPGPVALLWELPGGNVDGGEQPYRAAVRELLEETGYRPAELWSLPSYWDCAYSTRRRYSFVATGCRRHARAEAVDGPPIETVEVGPRDLVEIIMSGELTDSAAALGFLLAVRHVPALAASVGFPTCDELMVSLDKATLATRLDDTFVVDDQG